MNITELTDTVTSSVRIVDRLAGGVEALALAVVTRAAGWVASIPTLLLTSQTCEKIFDLAPTSALASAVALEVVGQSVVNTWLRARCWNRNKRQADRPASEWLMLAAMVGYFATDFTLVGILVMPKARVEPVYWAALLFPLAQVISTVVTGERAAQFRREAEAEADSAKRSAVAREARLVRARRKAERIEREAALLSDAQSQVAAQATTVVAVSGNGKKNTCPYCGIDAGKDGKPFANSQAVSAHLRRCETYQTQKAQVMSATATCQNHRGIV